MLNHIVIEIIWNSTSQRQKLSNSDIAKTSQRIQTSQIQHSKDRSYRGGRLAKEDNVLLSDEKIEYTNTFLNLGVISFFITKIPLKPFG